MTFEQTYPEAVAAMVLETPSEEPQTEKDPLCEETAISFSDTNEAKLDSDSESIEKGEKSKNTEIRRSTRKRKHPVRMTFGSTIDKKIIIFCPLNQKEKSTLRYLKL